MIYLSWCMVACHEVARLDHSSRRGSGGGRCGCGIPTDSCILSPVSFFNRACDQCGQATKGMWGMSWHQKAKKGVEDCDKPGEVVKRALIPGYPHERAL